MAGCGVSLLVTLDTRRHVFEAWRHYEDISVAMKYFCYYHLLSASYQTLNGLFVQRPHGPALCDIRRDNGKSK
jgi:hypothetical protein